MKCAQFVLAAVSAIFALSPATQAVSWKRADSIVGNDFYNAFNFFNGRDPTNGYVTYVAKEQAVQKKLTSVDGDSFRLAIDTTPFAPNGRAGVRLQSKALYTDGVYILKAKHVPTGCATWPAFWTLTWNMTNWPGGGEIDILENANDQYPYNLASLHVADKNCKISKSNNEQHSTVVFDSCYAHNKEQSGCRVAMKGTDTVTWGDKLNKMGGGIVAMERNFNKGGKGIRMWFWDSKSDVPDDVKNIGDSVNPDKWGDPISVFDVMSCKDSFDQHSIVLNIALCGDWAKGTYKETPCAKKFGQCSDQVSKHGDSFKEAYWDIKGLYVFTSNGENEGTTTISPDKERRVTASASLKGEPQQRGGSPMSVPTTTISVLLAVFLGAVFFLVL